MKAKPLSEITNPKQWKNLPISKLKDSGFPVYGANGIIGFFDEYNHAKPTIAITCRGATCGNIHVTREYSYITSNAMALDDLNENECKLNYLAKYLLFRGLGDVTTGAAQPQITRGNLEKVNIPLPPLDDQIRIAHLLGKVEGLIAQRKQHLQQLDDLLKSVFLEMFGDPVRNVKGWEKKLLQYLCHSPKDIKCGPFGTQLNKSEFQKSGIPVWGIPQINSEFAIPPNDFVTKEKAGELEEYSVRHNDIVMSRKGAVGKCSLYPPSMPPGIMHSDVLRIRADWAKTHPIYLCWQLRVSRDVEKQIANVSSGAIMAGINVGKLKSITVFTPPISLQNQFSAIVEKIEGIKYLCQQSLIDQQVLYGALSQQAFKGVLDLSQVASATKITKMGRPKNE